MQQLMSRSLQIKQDVGLLLSISAYSSAAGLPLLHALIQDIMRLLHLAELDLQLGNLVAEALLHRLNQNHKLTVASSLSKGKTTFITTPFLKTLADI